MAQQVPPPPPGFVIQSSAPSAPAPTRAPRRQQRQRPNVSFRDDRDALVRTVLGEAAAEPPEGQTAVAAVVLNRARQRNMTPSQVVLERNQFEPWGNPDTAARLLRVGVDDPRYIAAAAQVDRALAGEDPTGGADHFFAPRAQAALGRDVPSWAKGQPTVIGGHNFYNLGGSTEDVRMTAAQAPAMSGAVPPPPFGFEVVQGEAVADAPATDADNEITAGVRNVDGRAILDGKDMGPWEEYWTNQRRSQQDRQARVERETDPEYQRAINEARNASAAVPDRLRAVGLGGTLGFLTDINAEAQRGLQAIENVGRQVAGQEIEYGSDMAAQAARDAMRDDQARYAAERPLENLGLQVAGGFLTPGIGAAGRYVQAGQGADRLRRAGQVGFGTGAVAGAGYSEGNLIERADDIARGGVAGAGAGIIAQGALDRIGRAGQGGGAARRLSRQGVRLMPGQMVAETPIVGPMIRNAEDVAAGFNPLMAGVRQRQNEDVVRVAGQEALDTIGARLPRDARTGYQVSQNVRRVLGQRYDDVTSRVTAQVDDELTTDLADLVTRANQTLDDGNARRLERILNDKVINEFAEDGTLSGANFKRIEQALREQSERASRPTSTLADNDLAELLDESRDVVRNLIARQYPAEAAEIQNLNRGWAISKRIERAVSGSAGFAREGTPTPGELSQTVANMSSSGQIADERALLQGLATDARAVLPATVGDTGSGQRAVMGLVGVGAAGGGAVVSPALAPLIAAGVVTYSPVGIGLLNAVYRATDSRVANAAVRQLAEQARRNPALMPYYEDALAHVQRLGQTDTQAAQPSQAPQPNPIPVQ